MATASTEQRELDLVDKVDFRIVAVANNEDKLQQLLKVYLPALLLKLASEHRSVQNKVIEVCKRLETFIQAPGIVLPVAALLDQYKSATSVLLKHFDLVFIQHSIGRLEPEERRALIPKAIRGIGSDEVLSEPSPTVPNLFNVILRLLGDYKPLSRGTKEDLALRDEVFASSKDSRFVARWLGKVLLFRSGASIPPGLTAADVKFLTLGKPDTWNPSAKGLNLAETRIKVAAFLSSGAFVDLERFLPAIYAASSTDFRISSIGDDLLKRTSVSLEDKDLISKLFRAHSRLSSPYRSRILGLLSKSEVATTFTDEILAAFKQNMIAEVSSGEETAPSSGLELAKLRKAQFEFLNWAARIGPSKTDFGKVGGPIVDLLRGFVEDQGWPKPDSLSSDDLALRSRAYETIGILARSAPMTDISYLELAGWLFRSLSEDPYQDVVMNIESALSSLTTVLKRPRLAGVYPQLRPILLNYMTLDEDEGSAIRSARYAATKWANSCLPFSDVYARWIDILAVAGRRTERSEVVEEGRKGLDPWTYHADDDASKALPDWRHMVRVFFEENITERITGFSVGKTTEGMEVDETSTFQNFPGEIFFAFPVALEYCRRVLFLSALKDFKTDPGWERQLETRSRSNLESRQAIRDYLGTIGDGNRGLYRLLLAAFDGMVKENIKVVENCATTFVDVACFAPRIALATLAPRSKGLIPLITSNSKQVRALGARAFGILGAHPSCPEESFTTSNTSLSTAAKPFKTASGQALNAAEGAFLALGYLWSRKIYYQTSMEVSQDEGLVDVFPTLKSVSSCSASTQEAFLEAYTQLWTAGIGIMPGKEEGSDTVAYVTEAFVEPLMILAKTGAEKAITALGRLTLAFREDDLVTLVLEKLYSLYEVKGAEVQFAVGEAITAAVGCWDAGVVQLTLDVDAQEGSWRIGSRSDRVASALQKLLDDSKTTKPSLMKASGIWLFCIIQHCSQLEEVHQKLRECQAAFMRLLSARDDLVKETATRGLTLVFQRGDFELQKELQRDIVTAFTGTGPQIKVEEDTELFEAGALPTTDGNSIVSYKDIVSLANEVGDQSLIYKFMSLATDSATWSTRSAFGRFGLSNILSETEIDPKLYPKLFRYRFDPNPHVQKSMDDIWKALVKNASTVLDTHFDAIMQDLLKYILGKEWRVRQACCGAISDLIAGRPFPKYEPYYKDIWASALKVLDDVKGSVREAAFALCISLNTTLVRQLEESGSTAAARSMMKEALPFLLSEKAMDNTAEDVKLFATMTVIKIAKSGGKALNPYVPTLVPNLLGQLSTIEPETINYLYLRAKAESKEKIDKMRTAMVSQSPLTEAIEDSLRNADSDVINKLAPQLEETVKSSLGMATKVGCARLLITLVTRHTEHFRPHAARFLNLMEKQAFGKNDEVSKSYARAAAYIFRVAPDEARELYVNRFIKLYLDSEDETRREKIADAILALSKISPDHFTELESQLLPLAFLGKHDTDEYVEKEFEEVWSKHAGSGLTITRYIPEIIGLVQTCLGSAQWALKHAGALATSSVVAAITSSSDLTGQVNLGNLKAVWPIYNKSLLLKTFAKKEKLLEPFPDFVSKSKAWWSEDAQFAEQLKKIAIREANRNNDDYRPHAFKCLWKFAAARDDLTLLPEISKIVWEHIDLPNQDKDAMDVDKPKQRATRKVDPKSTIAWAGIEAVAKGYNRKKMAENPVGELNAIVLALEQGNQSKGKPDLENPYIGKTEFDIIRRALWYECVAEVLEAAGKSETKSGGEGLEVLKWYFATLDLEKADAGTEDQRIARARASIAALQLWMKQGGDGVEGLAQTKALVKEAIKKALREERSLEVQGKWKECFALLS
ncbi:proteasome stabiliser-domain-containing protein [Podospora aff. communis PSN243]|uniref:Proteasome stabiliser-domain-containing protein n=1 Tax=Podospora aff. communis PSN243 TaxID=3040156 RepID=A0AAV9H3F9_9PEZI|nr:proteasome stabiliser-domain-containing protein [Podospora aff. communis PSN243]